MSMLGSRVSTIAFPMLVLYLTRSPIYAGLAVFAATAPSVLFYMPAGALVDHWDPRRTMLVSELLRGLLIGGIVIIFFLDKSVPLIISLAVLEEIAEVFATLAERRYIRILVDSDARSDTQSDLAKSAPTRVEARSHVIVLIGRPLGGLLFETGHAFPFLADMASFAYSCLTLLRIKERPPTRPRRETRLQLGKEIIGGIRYLIKSKYVRDSVILNSWMTLISQALILIFIVESRSQHLSAIDIGVVLASSGLGGVIGAMLGKSVDRLIGTNFRILHGRSRVKIQLCIWSAGLLFLAVFMASWQVLCMAIVMAIFGFAGAIGNIELETYINHHVPKEMTARLASIDRLTSLLMCAAGPAIGGLLAGCWGAPTAVWLLFVMALVPTVVVVARALPRLERTPVPAPSRQAPTDGLSSASVSADSEEPLAASPALGFAPAIAEAGLLRPPPSDPRNRPVAGGGALNGTDYRSRGHRPVAEAEHDGNRAERPPEPGAGLVWCVRVVDVGPAHLQVLEGQARDRVRELHGRDVVCPEQPAPPERGEHAGQLGQVAGALRQRRRPGPEDRAVGIEGAELLPVHR